MFFHDKKLMFDVKVDSSDAQFAQMLLEQFGGATGELSAALTYWTQSFHVEDKTIRDMLHDIAIEEFSHLEMVGRMIEQHTEKAIGAAKDAAYKSTPFRGPRDRTPPRRQPRAGLDFGLCQRGRQCRPRSAR